MNNSAKDESLIDNPVEEPTSQSVHDPVCHMDVAATSTAGNSKYNGFTYYFCSPVCKESFDADPAAVLEMEREYAHGPAPETPSVDVAAGTTETPPSFTSLIEPIPSPSFDTEGAVTTEALGAIEPSVSHGSSSAGTAENVSRAEDGLRPRGRGISRQVITTLREQPLLQAALAFGAGALTATVLRRPKPQADGRRH